MSYGAAGYLRRSTPVDHLGDIYTMLEYSGRTPLASSEQVETHPVTDAMGNVWMPDPYASCLFLGDSFSNIYSLNGLGWGLRGRICRTALLSVAAAGRCDPPQR